MQKHRKDIFANNTMKTKLVNAGMGVDGCTPLLYRHIVTKSSSKAHSYKEHNCVIVFPLVSGRKAQAKKAARAHTTPWKRKRKWRASEEVLLNIKNTVVVGEAGSEGAILIKIQIQLQIQIQIQNTVVILTTWARQGPRVRY